MEFLCDVHIPIKLCKFLTKSGFKCTHVNQILNKWHTPDKDICSFVDANNLILITKDNDFKNSHLLESTPKKLIKINLGNISNNLLMDRFSKLIQQIAELNSKDKFVLEIDVNEINIILN